MLFFYSSVREVGKQLCCPTSSDGGTVALPKLVIRCFSLSAIFKLPCLYQLVYCLQPAGGRNTIYMIGLSSLDLQTLNSAVDSNLNISSKSSIFSEIFSEFWTNVEYLNKKRIVIYLAVI